MLENAIRLTNIEQRWEISIRPGNCEGCQGLKRRLERNTAKRFYSKAQARGASRAAWVTNEESSNPEGVSQLTPANPTHIARRCPIHISYTADGIPPEMSLTCDAHVGVSM